MICLSCGRWYNFHYNEMGEPLRTANAHSLSKGAGGGDEGDLPFCFDCHNTSHSIGMSGLEKEHPGVIERVKSYRELMINKRKCRLYDNYT